MYLSIQNFFTIQSGSYIPLIFVSPNGCLKIYSILIIERNSNPIYSNLCFKKLIELQRFPLFPSRNFSTHSIEKKLDSLWIPLPWLQTRTYIPPIFVSPIGCFKNLPILLIFLKFHIILASCLGN